MNHRRSRRVPASAGLTALALTAAVSGCAFSPSSTPSTSPIRGSGDMVTATGEQASVSSAALTGAARRPNVLLITADDAAPGDLRFMPHTRELIADRGVTFTNGVAPTPICVPARASLLTGQYTHNHKAYTIEGKGGGYTSFDSRNTLPTWLRRSGYDTLFIGKYLNGYGDAGTGTARKIEPGWTQWRPTVGGSTYNFMNPTLNINGRLVGYHQYNSNLFADQTVDLLGRSQRKRKPWFMWVNYVAPHHGGPLDADDPQLRYPRNPASWVKTTKPAPRDRNRFRDLRLPQDPNMFRRVRHGWDNGAPMSLLKRRNIREAYQQRIEALQSVDRGVARSVAALRRTGQLRNTVVMFTSDNGFLVGQHNRFGKLYSYNDSQRIPVVMSGPGVPRGKRVRTAVTNPDIAVTIAALARAKPGRRVDGIDFMPLLRMGYRGRVVPTEAYPVHGGTRPVYTGIREGTWTYTRLRRDGVRREELYNRATDPYELHNLAGNTRYAAELARFRALDRRYRDCAGATCPKAVYLPGDPPAG
ncbi:sulfatase family protein [Nocardioides guangzhouensis]|nr:sulfatase [Nocardioides guangzhouensis]